MAIHEGQQFWRWEISGGPVVIDIALDVVDRMASEIGRGLGAVPRRGIEVGGVLLGSTGSGSPVNVVIRDYEAVPSQYAFGPSYALSDGDLHAFQQTIDKWRFGPGDLRPVGYFRSHTRDGFEPSREDLDLMDRYFPDASNVILLVKPSILRPGTGAFFLHESIGLHDGSPVLEFPFRSRELTGGEYSGRPERVHERPAPRDEAAQEAIEPKALIAELPRAAASAAYEPTPERAESSWVTRLAWAVFFVALFSFGAAAGYFIAKNWPRGTPAASENPYALGLAGVKEGDGVLVRWNRDSRPVRSAWRGVLSISEGDQTRSIQLILPQLRNGSVLYRHLAPEIRFRLDVYLTEQNVVSESWTWKQQPAP